MSSIDFNTVTIGSHTGYGNASRLLVDSLEGQGVYISPGSSIMLNFCMPTSYKFSDRTIGYTPWESTEIPRDWVKPLNAVDELWTTSKWCARIFSEYRRDEVKVLPHGIEDCWTPVKRRRSDTFTFLHVGEPAVRKGGDLLLQAWWKAFAHRKDVHLIYKCIKYPMCRVKDNSGSIVASPESLSNVSVLSHVMSPGELYDLYVSSDCMVYPTRGEGFGLIPFEAMATGLPTIFPEQGGTGDFAAYSPYTLKNSIWVNSTEERIHPGLWLDHSVDEIIDLMTAVIDNYDYATEGAYASAKEIHQEYSWGRIGELASDLILN